MADPELTRKFEELGPDLVRARLKQMAPNAEIEAIAWLAQKDREARESAASAAAMQADLARSAASDASRAADAAERAASANERAADAALNANKIAVRSAIMAAIAVVISIIGFGYTVWHDSQTKDEASYPKAHGR